MSDAQGFDKIGGIDKIGPKKLAPVADPTEMQPETRVAPDKEKFDQVMQEKTSIEQKGVNTVEAPEKRSLMDEVRHMSGRMESLATSSPEAIRLQAEEVIKKIEDLKIQLQTPDLKIKGSVQRLLNNKLSHIDDNLKIALNKAGVEYTPPTETPAGLNPVQRFIGGLTWSQYQLQNIGNSIEQMQLTGKEFTPANMLSLQIKVAYVQQELEFFTSLLNKALESTKTLMNVQV